MEPRPAFVGLPAARSVPRSPGSRIASGVARGARRADRLRRRLGISWRKTIVLARRPVRVVLFVSRRPSLSVAASRFTMNIAGDGVMLTTRVAKGLSHRTRVYVWPWVGARRPRRWRPL